MLASPIKTLLPATVSLKNCGNLKTLLSLFLRLNFFQDEWSSGLMGARSVCGHVGFVFGKDNKVIKVSFSHTKSHSNSSVSWLPILPEGYQYSQPHPTQPLCPNLALWLWRCLDAGILAHHSLPFHQCCSWSHLCCRLGLNSLKEELQFQWIPRRWGFVPGYDNGFIGMGWAFTARPGWLSPPGLAFQIYFAHGWVSTQETTSIKRGVREILRC